MKKRILRRIILPVLLAVLAFPSCGNGEAEPPDMPPSRTEPTKGEKTEMQTFDIKKTCTIDFTEGTYAEAFNRFTMTYTSGEPLRCSIAYTEEGENRSDEFFLEAGENVTFSCLTGNYLAGQKGIDLTALTLSTCRGNDTQFTLHELTTEDYPVYSSDTCYLENDRFRVGVRLMWGGGICYISDERNPVSGLKNLVNQADTGRLIQQSYYGTGPNGEYTPGTFNNSDWRYNPVQ